jgi:hypothetical protein
MKMKKFTIKQILLLVTLTVASSNISFAQCTITPNAGPDKINCNNTGATLQASGGDYYSWAPATGLSNTFQSNPIANPSVTTTYTLTAYQSINNVVLNLDFSQGNTAFTSQYAYVADDPNATNELVPEGKYGVGTNAHNYHPSFNGLGRGGSGNFMIVNGATVTGVGVWQQSVTIQPNTTYYFGCWISAINPANLAQLAFSINGQVIGNSPTISPILPVGTWTQFYTSWFSGTSTTANIQINNINTQFTGNDFGLDDITFTTICTATATDIVVVTPSTIGASFTTVKPTCVTNGSVDVTLNQGSIATSYLWSNGATTQDISNLTPATYKVTITNPQGCTTIKEAVLPVPAPVQVTKVVSNVKCNGANNGSIDITVSSGTSPYIYTWSNGSTQQDISSLSPSTYSVTVKDANQCSTTNSTVITQPSILTVSGVATPNSSCTNICNGAINITVLGGTAPYNYTWTPTASSEDLTAVCNGNYSVVVKDVNQCSVTGSYIVENACQAVTPCNAIQVMSFIQKKRKNGSSIALNRSNPNKALGVPEGIDGFNYVSLGFGGSIVLKLDNVVYNHVGADLVIVETTFSNPTCTANPERARIEVSMDNITYTNLGIICQDGTIDLGNVISAQYIKITDVSDINSSSFVGTSDGYDIDGVMCYIPGQRYEDNVNTPDLEMAIEVYPNPVNDILNIEYMAMGNSTFYVHDYVGKELYSENFDAGNLMNGTKSIDIRNYPAGIYMVTLQSSNETKTIKVIKK